jgi:hypothetical protein
MDAHERFLESLTQEEEQLLVLRDFLYAGQWEEVIADLQARLAGRPFVFKLSTRIDEDLDRIERLRAYESLHQVDLGDYLIRSGKYPELQDLLEAEGPSADAGSSASSKGGGKRSRAGS